MIEKMSLQETNTYADARPDEAWRFAKTHYSSAVKQTKKATKHGLKAWILAPEPEMVEVV